MWREVGRTHTDVIVRVTIDNHLANRATSCEDAQAHNDGDADFGAFVQLEVADSQEGHDDNDEVDDDAEGCCISARMLVTWEK